VNQPSKARFPTAPSSPSGASLAARQAWVAAARRGAPQTRAAAAFDTSVFADAAASRRAVAAVVVRREASVGAAQRPRARRSGRALLGRSRQLTLRFLSRRRLAVLLVLAALVAVIVAVAMIAPSGTTRAVVTVASIVAALGCPGVASARRSAGVLDQTQEQIRAAEVDAAVCLAATITPNPATSRPVAPTAAEAVVARQWRPRQLDPAGAGVAAGTVAVAVDSREPTGSQMMIREPTSSTRSGGNR
jgi:hypothetical protein